VEWDFYASMPFLELLVVYTYQFFFWKFSGTKYTQHKFLFPKEFVSGMEENTMEVVIEDEKCDQLLKDFSSLPKNCSQGHSFKLTHT